MKHPPPNPYARMPLDGVVAAAQRAAAELAEVRTRTPVERAELAQRCRHLLLSLSMCVAPGQYVPDAPENQLKPEDLADVYWRWITAQVNRDPRPEHADAVRRLALCRAADYAGIVGAVTLRQHVPDDAHTDAGRTRAVLEHLQAVAVKRRGRG